MELTNLPYRPWLLVAGLLESIGGVVLSHFFPKLSRLNPDYQFHPESGIGAGLLFSGIAAAVFHNLYIVAPVGLVFGYMIAWLRPDKKPEGPAPLEEPKPAPADPVTRLPLQQGWDRRTRYETQENGLFVGREELVERLTADFSARSTATILISGGRR